mmetsp:Transcript_42962/g.71408  ORF Transcript_42962/g.71408 Transcript_42962/m.71408 type:complete len:221 (-) Transcript_42962:348-1010(-)|eukprot:CAMPEP_0119310190 /NCGR_PEP_ID=MMETSP1333-20130426/17973_1 /TAXON_ID=418940 /ORGANISM="Scyphosphaera apsteinii, Strain RCC1455" /LENGTH=220 /DNA_ID=CAMNT_0007314323 /DNA_START=32 /DNA_END=694 /DNA_ORIENTATION=+
MRTAALLLGALLLYDAAPAPPVSDKEREVRLKTTRQLKEILTALNIPFSSSASKEELRALAVKKNAIAKYEKKFPSQARKSRSKRKGGGSGAGIAQAGQIFPMMDMDKNGKVSQKELMDSGIFGPAGDNPDAIEQGFVSMDSNGDGSVSKPELAKFLELMSQQREAMEAGVGDPYGYGAYDSPPVDLSNSPNVVGDDEIDYALDDDDTLVGVEGTGVDEL